MEVRWEEKTRKGILEVEYEMSSFNDFTEFVPLTKVCRIWIAKYVPGNLYATKRINSFSAEEMRVCVLNV